MRFSTGAFRCNDGTPIEGVGITPDLPVMWTVADLRQGRDPNLEAAERLLHDQGGMTLAGAFRFWGNNKMIADETLPPSPGA